MPYRWAVAGYAVFLLGVLLWPFRIDLPDSSVPNTAVWRQDAGLVFPGEGVARTAIPPTELYEHMRSAAGITVEVWAETASIRQDGPARLVSASGGINARNFTLGQSGTAATFRLRTTATNDDGAVSLKDGARVEAVLPDAFAAPGLRHIVVSDDLHRRRAWLDGRPVLDAPSPGGTFANWSDDFPLLFGNEASGTRPWLGRLALAALYDRALNDREVSANFAGGRVAEGRMFEYRLREERPEAFGLVLPAMVEKPARQPQLIPYAEIIGRLPHLPPMVIGDMIVNILLFMPFGFALRGALTPGMRARTSGIAVILLAGLLFSGMMEAGQLLLEARSSSITDVLNNGLGTLLGAIPRPSPGSGETGAGR
jgi:VanZ like family/Concanavalin A-like lectin/glucanases superfamily